VNTLELRSMDLRQCSGCFGCWLKTPGVCATQDQHGQLIRAYLDADVAVLASPLVLGFSSGLLKRAADKLIPILLPYIDASTGECRHFPRYPNCRDWRCCIRTSPTPSTRIEPSRANLEPDGPQRQHLADCLPVHDDGHHGGRPCDCSRLMVRPRTQSNSRFLTDEFLRGFAVTPANQAETLDIARRAIGKRRSRLFGTAMPCYSAFHCTRTPCPAW